MYVINGRKFSVDVHQWTKPPVDETNMYLGEREGNIMVKPVLQMAPTVTMDTKRSRLLATKRDLETGSGEKGLQSLLIDYADYRDFQSLMNYIKAGGDLDIQLNHSYQLTTPLCEASKRYDTCAMNKMFENKCDVNFPDGHGNTPLFLAAKCHKIGSVFMLLQEGAEPDICNRFGKTPLTVAMENFSNHCVELLVEAGASVNVPIASRRGLNCIPGDVTSPLEFALLISPSPFPMANKLIYAGALVQTLPEEAISILLNRPGTNKTFLELLFAAGFRLTCKQWIKERERQYAEGIISDRDLEFLNLLKEETTSPSSLQTLARTEIRKCVTLNKTVKGHIKVRLEHLELPKSIVRYLKLEVL